MRRQLCYSKPTTKDPFFFIRYLHVFLCHNLMDMHYLFDDNLPNYERQLFHSPNYVVQ
jgi:5'(3')-deoxyribonucleotidase